MFRFKSSFLAASLGASLFACGGDSDPRTVVDVAVEDGRFTLLAAALTRADLVGALEGEGPFTVFAPTDDAFAASGLDATDIQTLPVDALRGILLYHVLPGAVGSSALPAAAETLSVPAGDDVGLSVVFNTTSGARVNQADIVLTDILADNGVIHVIDEVIMPSNIAQLATYAGFTQLLGVVGQASAIPQGTPLTPSGTLAVADALAAESVELTVFAPTNAAFEAIASTAATLTADQKRDVLLYHVVNGRVLSTQLTNGAVPTLLDLVGPSPDITLSTTGPTVTGACNGSPSAIGPADIVATNGVIHVVSSVLLPIGCP